MAGRLAFDRDGYLYLTLGDRFTPTDGDLTKHVAQDLSNHMGKTVRLHDDGRVPADNPFVGRAGALPEIWSYGHRNAQGMAFHPTTRELWQSESGAEGGDELNVIRRGANYGWPVIGFSREYGGATLHDASARDGMEQPVHHWTPAIVPSGIMIYTGNRFPNWRGNIFVAGLGGEQLSRIVVDGNRFVAEEVLLKNSLGRLRDVRQGPNGDIYVAIDGGVEGKPTRVVRLVPKTSDRLSQPQSANVAAVMLRNRSGLLCRGSRPGTRWLRSPSAVRSLRGRRVAGSSQRDGARMRRCNELRRRRDPPARARTVRLGRSPTRSTARDYHDSSPMDGPAAGERLSRRSPLTYRRFNRSVILRLWCLARNSARAVA